MNSHEILAIFMNVFLLTFSLQDNMYIYTDNTIEIGEKRKILTVVPFSKIYRAFSLFSMAMIVVKYISPEPFWKLNLEKCVIIDKKFLEGKSKPLGDPMENIMEIVANELLKYKTKVNVQYSTDININYRKDLFGIVAIASCENSWKLFEQADNALLPFIAVTDMDCPRLPIGKAISIPLLENGQELPQLLLDLRTSGTLKWNSLILLHDSSIGGDMVSRVTSCLTKEFTKLSIDPLALSLIKINNNQTKDARFQILGEISKISTGKLGSHYLVICFKDIVNIVMDVVDTLKLVNGDSQWLYIISEINHHRKGYFKVLNNLLKFGSNVAFIYNNTSSDNECEGGVYCNFRILLRGYLSALQEILNDEFNAEDDFSGEEWEAIRPSKSDRRTTLINKLRLFLKNNERCYNCTRWSFRSSDTWGLEYESSVDTAAPRTLKVGTWTPTAGVEMFDELFLHVAHGFRRKNLQLVTIHNPPWQIISVDQSENKTRYKGLVFDIIEELSKKLNFTYSVKVIRNSDAADKTNVSSSRLAFDSEYDKNGNDLPDIDTNCIPTEVIDMITNKSVAIGAFVATISEKYLHLLEFSSPISTQSYSFLVARPKELSRALLFMAPFSGDTWLCLLLAVLGMVPILYYVHTKSLQLQSRKDGELVTFQNCAWFIYGAMLQQGGMHIITVDSARILVGIWWLVVLVISTTYCGNLVAFLTFPVIDTSLSTFHDILIHKDKISWTLAGGSFLEEHIKSIGDSSYKYLYSMKSNKKRNLESIADIISGRHVLIDWKIRLEYLLWREYIESKKCELAIGSDEIFAENLGLVMSVNNPYLLRINREIKQLHQVGLIHKWLMAYLPKEKECWKYGQIFKANNHVVNIEDMQGSFFVLLLGTFFSLVLITGEFIWFHFTTVKKSHKNIKPFAR